MDRQLTTNSDNSDTKTVHRAAGASEPASIRAHAEQAATETWYGELWHATAHAFVQSPYDGIKQDVNHISKSLTGKELMADRQLVAPVDFRNDLSAVGIAQDVGSGLGTLPYFMGVAAALRKLPESKMVANSLPLVGGEAGRQVLRNATAAAIVEGALVPAKDDTHWLANKLGNASLAFTTFAVAGAATEALNSTPQFKKLLGTSGNSAFSSELLTAGVEKATTMGSAGLGGAIGGATGAELSSLLVDHKNASLGDIANRSLRTAAMMSTLSALRPGWGQSAEEKLPDVPEQIRRLAGFSNEVSTGIKGKSGIIENPELRAQRVDVENGTPRASADHALKLEGHARALAAQADYQGTVKAMTGAIDSYEALKRSGGTVDDAHLRKLYDELATAKQNADKP